MKKITIPDPGKTSGRENDSLQKIVDSLSFVSKDLKTLALCACDKKTDLSSLTVRLAQIKAKQGCRVLIIRAALQDPAAGIQEMGLTHYLVGQCGLEDILYETNLEGISIIPAGAYAINPELLVGFDELQKLIHAYRDRFDWVLIETAPITKQNASAAHFVACSDGAVFVIKDRATYGYQLLSAKKAIEKTNRPIIGCIVTDAKSAKAYA